MVTFLLLILHIVACLVLILVVLLQTGKRADIAGAFGGGGSQTAFGARGAATFLSKATTWSAVMFMLTSVLLGVRFGRGAPESVVKEPGGRPPLTTPAAVPQPVPLPAPKAANPAPAEGGAPAPPEAAPPAAPGGKAQPGSPAEQPQKPPAGP